MAQSSDLPPRTAAFLSLEESLRSTAMGLLIGLCCFVLFCGSTCYLTIYERDINQRDAQYYIAVIMGIGMMGIAAAVSVTFSLFQCYAIVPFVPSSRRLLNYSFYVPAAVCLLLMTYLCMISALNQPFKPMARIFFVAIFYASFFGMGGLLAQFAGSIADAVGEARIRQRLGILAAIFFALIALILVFAGFLSERLAFMPLDPRRNVNPIRFENPLLVAVVSSVLLICTLLAIANLAFNLRRLSRECCTFAWRVEQAVRIAD